MENQATIDYSEYFDGDVEALSYHLMLPYREQMNKEAELRTRSGHATMVCDLSKREKHG